MKTVMLMIKLGGLANSSTEEVGNVIARAKREATGQDHVPEAGSGLAKVIRKLWHNCAEYKLIRAAQLEAKKKIEGKAKRCPWFASGFVCVQADRLGEIMAELDRAQDDLEGIVEAFIAVMPKAFADAKRELWAKEKILVDDGELPTPADVRAKCRIEYRPILTDDGVRLEDLDPASQQRIVEMQRADARKVTEELASELGQRIQTIVGQLSPTPEGRRKKGVRVATLENIKEFVRNYDNRAARGTALDALVETIGNLLGSENAELLRAGPDAAKRQLATQLSNVQEELEKIAPRKRGRVVAIAIQEGVKDAV